MNLSTLSVFKFNPYHDELGRFSDENKAKFVSMTGVFEKYRKAHPPEPPRVHAEDCVQNAEVDRREEELLEAVKEWGLEKEYAAAQKNMAALLSTARVQINRKNVSTVESILLDGRMKTQWETGTSGGMLDLKYRRTAELAQFGKHEGKKEDRPLYGLLQSRDADEDDQRGGIQYGRLRITLKRRMNAQSTFTGGDSLAHFSRQKQAGGGYMGSLQSTAVTTPKLSSFFDINTFPSVRFEHRKKAFKEALERISSARSVQQMRSPEEGYVESQIHGQVRAGDIEKISVPKGTKFSKEALAKAKELGISIEER